MCLPKLTYIRKLLCTITCIFSVLECCQFLKRGAQVSISRIDPTCLLNNYYARERSSITSTGFFWRGGGGGRAGGTKNRIIGETHIAVDDY